MIAWFSNAPCLCDQIAHEQRFEVKREIGFVK